MFSWFQTRARVHDMRKLCASSQVSFALVGVAWRSGNNDVLVRVCVRVQFLGHV